MMTPREQVDDGLRHLDGQFEKQIRLIEYTRGVAKHLRITLAKVCPPVRRPANEEVVKTAHPFVEPIEMQPMGSHAPIYTKTIGKHKEATESKPAPAEDEEAAVERILKAIKAQGIHLEWHKAEEVARAVLAAQEVKANKLLVDALKEIAAMAEGPGPTDPSAWIELIGKTANDALAAVKRRRKANA